MSLSDSELEHLIPELAERLVGSLVSNSWQPARDHVLLGFSDGTRLLLCPRGPDARLHTVTRRPKNPPRPFSFQGACRAHLSGPLTALQKHAGDRVIDLVFGEKRLHLRLTGRSGGLWLLHGDSIIAAYDGPAPEHLPSLPEGKASTKPPRMETSEEGGWDRAIERFFRVRIRERREKELRIVVARDLRRKIARLGRLLENLERDLEKADGVDHLRRCGDALAANLHRISQGADHVELEALDDPSVMLRVALKPDRSPAKSLDALYSKARRLDRMGDRVLERLESTQQELQALQYRQEKLDELDFEGLQGLGQEIRPKTRQRGRKIPGVTTWIGPGGQCVLVGRDARANRRLSFQVAKGADYWMHVRGRPGSHIILPMTRGQTPPLELLLAAGQIAAVHAGIDNGDRIEVQYTRARDVRSVPKTEAKVRVFNEKVLQIIRDPSELTGWERQESQ